MNVLPGPPMRRDDEAIEESPVPPPATVSVPESEGVKVRLEPEPTIVSALVRPLVVEVVEPIPTAPVNVCPVGPMERTPVFEMVTLPVAPETEMPVPATLERTPVLVTLPAEYKRPDEKVVVATHEGTPETSERICPFVPCVVVETAPVPLPRRSVFAWRFPQPVPPRTTPNVPEVRIEVSRLVVPAAVSLPC